MRSARPAILQEREKTHGDFSENARISQALKDVFYSNNPHDLSAVHRECLDMIALKLSRIIAGKANVREHWVDVSGYALLAAESCDE